MLTVIFTVFLERKKMISKKIRIIVAFLSILCLLLCGCVESSLDSDDSASNSGDNTIDSSISDDTDKSGDDDSNTVDNDNSSDNGVTDQSTDNGTPKELSVGDTAPDFTATLAGGGTFKLSDHYDEVVLINLWATWCSPCVYELPEFEQLKADNIENFDLICINCLEDTSTVDRFIKENGYTINIAYDTDGNIVKYYPSDGIPYTVIVNKGVISQIFVGLRSYNEYRSAIDEALAK